VRPVDGAATGSEVVALAVPAGVVAETAARLGDLAGKVVIDCTNALGPGFTLKHGHTTSAAEELARALPGARVVRSFNQQGAETLRDARFGDLRAVNFVAGDDADARAVVKALAEDVGLDAVDVGPLASSRLLEPITLLWIAAAKALGTREIGLALMRR
jgi:predicted dinucleotide-binding enzyme